MSKEELKSGLHQRAVNLRDWFAGTLEIRESRPAEQIQKISASILERAFQDGFAEDEFYLIWSLFEDEVITWTRSPDAMESDLGLTIEPVLTPAEYALAIGLVFSHSAADCLTSHSHEQHLLATHLLVSATEAREYWLAVRGITGCRNPDRKLVNAETSIKHSEFELWFKDRQSAQGRKAVEARHDQAGGSREKRKKVQDAWQTGEYRSKNECAEKMSKKLGISFKAARNALYNVPEPECIK